MGYKVNPQAYEKFINKIIASSEEVYNQIAKLDKVVKNDIMNEKIWYNNDASLFIQFWNKNCAVVTGKADANRMGTF